MGRPRFSILIPTRDRPETLVHALATVAAQSGDDFEIVVADNCSREAVKQAVDAVTNCPVVYVRSDSVLTMTENWLKGLAACSGDYITILGDDDGLMPTALDIARRALKTPGRDLLTWAPNTYNWPNVIVRQWAGFLTVAYTNSLQGIELKSQEILKGFWYGLVDLKDLPMLYNSFVHRDLLERTQEKWGSMIPLPHCPDVYSGLFNLCLVDNVFRSLRPLSINGASGSSGGFSQVYPKLGKKILNKVLNEEGLGTKEATGSRYPVHPTLLTKNAKAAENFYVHIASLKLFFRDFALPNNQELSIDIPRLIQEILAMINYDPDNYACALAYVQDLATQNNIIIDPAMIPELNPIGDEPPPGRPSITQLNEVQWQICLDGNLADISNINMACRLAESLLPPLD